MAPDCRQGHMSRWDRDDKGRAGSFRKRFKTIHQVCCVQSTSVVFKFSRVIVDIVMGPLIGQGERRPGS